MILQKAKGLHVICGIVLCWKGLTMNERNSKKGFYYICDVETDLPLYIADTFTEAMNWIGCSGATLYRMIKYGNIHKGMQCYKLQDF